MKVVEVLGGLAVNGDKMSVNVIHSNDVVLGARVSLTWISAQWITASPLPPARPTEQGFWRWVVGLIDSVLKTPADFIMSQLDKENQVFCQL